MAWPQAKQVRLVFRGSTRTRRPPRLESLYSRRERNVPHPRDRIERFSPDFCGPSGRDSPGCPGRCASCSGFSGPRRRPRLGFRLSRSISCGENPDACSRPGRGLSPPDTSASGNGGSSSPSGISGKVSVTPRQASFRPVSWLRADPEPGGSGCRPTMWRRRRPRDLPGDPDLDPSDLGEEDPGKERASLRILSREVELRLKGVGIAEGVPLSLLLEPGESLGVLLSRASQRARSRFFNACCWGWEGPLARNPYPSLARHRVRRRHSSPVERNGIPASSRAVWRSRPCSPRTGRTPHGGTGESPVRKSERDGI